MVSTAWLVPCVCLVSAFFGWACLPRAVQQYTWSPKEHSHRHRHWLFRLSPTSACPLPKSKSMAEMSCCNIALQGRMRGTSGANYSARTSPAFIKFSTAGTGWRYSQPQRLSHLDPEHPNERIKHHTIFRPNLELNRLPERRYNTYSGISEGLSAAGVDEESPMMQN